MGAPFGPFLQRLINNIVCTSDNDDGNGKLVYYQLWVLGVGYFRIILTYKRKQRRDDNYFTSKFNGVSHIMAERTFFLGIELKNIVIFRNDMARPSKVVQHRTVIKISKPLKKPTPYKFVFFNYSSRYRS